ncbi:MAG: DeoR/GlpR transcriptional regulator [Verrucomicrobia bacterium]|jgi:DeoR/GlpR family transcriptional regulator of sugar metabolism|nr:DeoR/GlpR transcriptional regulator [Verrucomicrobiota bacterium]
MLAIERHREILAVLSKEGSVRVTELSERFAVTEETIRRDLGKLEAQGRIVRSHGGALMSEPEETLRPFAWREVANEPEKAAIVRAAVQRIEEGDSILLDASTTAWHMAKRLNDIPMAVITNSLQIPIALSNRGEIDVHVLGGRLGKKSLSFIGPTAEAQLQQYHVDRLFLSCKGADLDRGISDVTEAQAHLRRIMLDCADKKYLLVDHSKFGQRSLAQICKLTAFDEIITDSGTDSAIIDRLCEMGIKTTVVPVDEEN